MQVIEKIVKTKDNFPLATIWYEPEITPHGQVLIASAMGVVQEFYSKFAAWLCTRGFRVISFDYRGIGKSGAHNLPNINANIFDWAELDAEAVLLALHTTDNKLPLIWLGHSLGGQIVSFLPHQHLLSKVITVGSGSGYWKKTPLLLRLRVWWLWYIAAPLACKVYGYFPGKKLRKVGDLPKNVMMQWRAWCLHPKYALGVEGEKVRKSYAKFSPPLLSIAFTDDEYMSEYNINDLHNNYCKVDKKLLFISPKEFHLDEIGHFGFFKIDKSILWEKFILN